MSSPFSENLKKNKKKFIIARTRKQRKCPSMKEWIKKVMVHIYNGILLSHKKVWQSLCPAMLLQMALCHTEWRRQRKINIIWYHFYVESLKKYKWTLQNRNRLMDIENKLKVTKREKGWKERNQESGINRHILSHIK